MKVGNVENLAAKKKKKSEENHTSKHVSTLNINGETSNNRSNIIIVLYSASQFACFEKRT